jgi:hypothetical protein
MPLLTRRRARLQTPVAAEEVSDAVQESEEGAAGAAAGETTQTTTATKAKKKQARSEK